MPSGYPVEFVAGDYRPEEFFQMAKGHEEDEEGANAVPYALECGFMRRQSWPKRGFDWFTTTLTISPMKDAARLNRIGEEAGKNTGSVFSIQILRKRTATDAP